MKALSGCEVNPQPDEMAAEKMLTPKQIADLMQVSPRTVTKLLETGKMKGTKISPRLWRIKESDFEAYQNKGGGE